MKTVKISLIIIAACILMCFAGSSCTEKARQNISETVSKQDTLKVADSVTFRAKRIHFSETLTWESFNIELVKVPFGYHPTDTIVIVEFEKAETYRLMERVDNK